MPKLLHTLCCCVARSSIKNHKEKNYKQSNLDDSVAVNPASIITQVSKSDVVLDTKTTIGGSGGRLRGTSTSAGNSATAFVTDTISASAPVVNSAISVTSPLPTEQFVLRGTAAAIAEFKAEKEYKDCLLPAPRSHDTHKKCLIVDLDETLVHSSFKPVKNADFIIPVEIDNVVHQVYVLKRPYADEFLERIGSMFECVLFTASLAKYADPVADLLDKRGTFRARLFREACVFFGGNYVKDLDRLGRDLEKVVIIDNSPASYAFHPENAVPVRTWFDDPHDCELLDMLPLLEEIADSHNIYHVLQRISGGGAGQQALGNSSTASTAASVSYGNVISMAPTINTNHNYKHSNTMANNKGNNNNNYNKHCRNNSNIYDLPATILTNTTSIITSSSSLPNSYGNSYNINRNHLENNSRDRNNNNNNSNNTAQSSAFSSNNNRGFGNNNNFCLTDSKR